MAKKKAAKRTTKKAAGRKRPAAPKGTPAPLDPIAAALLRRRLALIAR